MTTVPRPTITSPGNKRVFRREPKDEVIAGLTRCVQSLQQRALDRDGRAVGNGPREGKRRCRLRVDGSARELAEKRGARRVIRMAVRHGDRGDPAAVLRCRRDQAPDVPAIGPPGIDRERFAEAEDEV